MLLVTLIFLNVLFLAIYFIRTPYRRLWTSPFTYILVFYIPNYPLRAALLLVADSFNTYDLTSNQMATALLYASVFVAVGAILESLLLRRTLRLARPASHQASGNLPLLPLHICFGIWLLATVALFAMGKVFTLYTSETDLHASFVVNLFSTLESLKWFVLAYCLVALRRRSQKIVQVELVVTVVAIVLSTLITTAKGPMAYLVLIYLIWTSMTNRRPRLALLAIGVAAFFSVSIYSYVARYYGTVRGEFSREVVQSNIETVYRKLSDGYAGREMGARGTGDRISYLDGLALCIENRDWVSRGSYAFGSMVEFLNLVPRFAWPDRPFYSFNHQMTSDVWGAAVFSEMPIGRIGESYYVLGPLGIAYAALYVGLYFFLYRRLYLLAANAYLNVVYIWLLITICFPDAYLLYNLKLAVSLLPVTVGAGVLCRILVQRSGARRRAQYPVAVDRSSSAVGAYAWACVDRR
jgi:hypothetical protein